MFAFKDSDGSLLVGRSTGASFQCGCTDGGICWVPEAACPAGSTPIATPNACSVQQPGGAATVMGWLAGTECLFPPRPWAPGGSSVANAAGMGGQYNVKQACFSGKPPRPSRGLASCGSAATRALPCPAPPRPRT